MMRTWIGIVSGAALLVGVAFAHEHEEFEKWMKATNANFGSIRKSVEAKQGPETAAAADKLAAIFEQVKGHFEEDKLADGVEFSKAGHEAAKDLATAANAGEWDKASADVKKIGATCQGCHAAHREKSADGTYKMK